jgi:hypothetical protein
VRYEHSQGLPALLEQLGLTVLLSTYQTMGLCRTASGIALGTRDGIWRLPASREIAPHIKPEGEHVNGLLAWGGERLWLVCTLFNVLVTIDAGWAAGDRYHLNGLAMAEDGSAPAYLSALGEADTENGWRENKATSDCLIQLTSGEVLLRGLSMPHFPRLYEGQQDLLCGLAIVDLALGAVRELLWFHSGLEKVFAICVVLTALNQEVNQTDIACEPLQATCLGSPVAKG